MHASVIAIARDVFAKLGPGYSESIYHKAMCVGLQRRGLPYETERIVVVKYDVTAIGNLRIDLVIDNEYIAELKSISGGIKDKEKGQLARYMDLTGIREGSVINFPPIKDTIEVYQPSSAVTIL